MTSKRHDKNSTEFGLWLREQKEVDSDKGYICSNIDYLWSNYKTGLWMILEEKRYCRKPKWWQFGLYQLVDIACRANRNYRGFHVIIFERTSPDDGEIWLDGGWIQKNDLLEFLMFNKPAHWYNSYFPERSNVDRISERRFNSNKQYRT